MSESRPNNEDDKNSPTATSPENRLLEIKPVSVKAYRLFALPLGPCRNWLHHHTPRSTVIEWGPGEVRQGLVPDSLHAGHPAMRSCMRDVLEGR